jgi:protein O-mannosyl-transferase
MSKKSRQTASRQPAAGDRLDRLATWFQRPGRPTEWWLVAGLAAVCLVVYANSLGGQFVYDDNQQILQNPAVRSGQQLWRAFSNDVWAFKTGGQAGVSDYWRPLFVVWLAVNRALFGLDSTTGWHVANLLLHVGVVLVGYGLLRSLPLARPVAAAVMLLFAVHPVHVESVAWISGSPDTLMSLAILGALWLVLPIQQRATATRWLAALGLYLLALLVKETAVVFPLLLFVTACVYRPRSDSSMGRLKTTGKFVLPFLLVTAVYLVARLIVMGQLAGSRPWQRPLLDVLLSLPGVLTFYLRQLLLPIRLGPSYPWRIIGPDEIGLASFWLPLLVVLAVIGLLLWLARGRPLAQLGLAIFALFLMPALNLNAFNPEHIVHDRYLYLPLLGALLVVADLAMAGLSRRPGFDPERAGSLVFLAALVLSVPLAWQTARYNRAWQSDVELWAWGVRSDPGSVFNRYLYGYALARAGQPAAAVEQFTAVINDRPLSGPYYSYQQAVEAHLERADIASRQGDLASAAADLQTVVHLDPADLSREDLENHQHQRRRAYERLAIVYQQQGRIEETVALLHRARLELPGQACSLTANLAVVLYLSGQKEQALNELENIRHQVEAEYSALCRMNLFYLGQLYNELGRQAEAQALLESYLALSEPFYDSQTQNLQRLARQLLRQIQPGS